MHRKILARVGLVVLVAIANLGVPAQARAAASSGRWTYSLTPYLWLSSVDGTLKYNLPPGSGSPTVEVDSETLLNVLDFGFMLAGEARRGRWSVFADYIYLKLSASKSAVRSVDFDVGAPAINPSSTTANLGTEATLKGSVLTLAGGYSLSDNSESRMDAIAAQLPCHGDHELAALGRSRRARTGTDLRRSREHFPDRGSVGRHRRRAWLGEAGRQMVPSVLPGCRNGFLGSDVAGAGRIELRIQMGRADLRLPPSRIRPEGRQAAAGLQVQRSHARRDIPFLKAAIGDPICE